MRFAPYNHKPKLSTRESHPARARRNHYPHQYRLLRRLQRRQNVTRVTCLLCRRHQNPCIILKPNNSTVGYPPSPHTSPIAAPPLPPRHHPQHPTHNNTIPTAPHPPTTPTQPSCRTPSPANRAYARPQNPSCRRRVRSWRSSRRSSSVRRMRWWRRNARRAQSSRSGWRCWNDEMARSESGWIAWRRLSRGWKGSEAWWDRRRVLGSMGREGVFFLLYRCCSVRS